MKNRRITIVCCKKYQEAGEILAKHLTKKGIEYDRLLILGHGLDGICKTDVYTDEIEGREVVVITICGLVFSKIEKMKKLGLVVIDSPLEDVYFKGDEEEMKNCLQKIEESIGKYK